MLLPFSLSLFVFSRSVIGLSGFYFEYFYQFLKKMYCLLRVVPLLVKQTFFLVIFPSDHAENIMLRVSYRVGFEVSALVLAQSSNYYRPAVVYLWWEHVQTFFKSTSAKLYLSINTRLRSGVYRLVGRPS